MSLLSPRAMAYLLIFISSAPLMLALLAQYGFGLLPCELCIWQRYPYGLLLLLAFAAWLRPQKLIIILYVSAVLWSVEAGLAFYHVGVEQHWWSSATGCSASMQTASLDALRAQIMGAPLVACDSPALVVFGLSMAGWNGLYSLLMALCLTIISREMRKI